MDKVSHEKLKLIIEIPKEEKKEFEILIKDHRKKYIKNARLIVDEVFEENQTLSKLLSDKYATQVIMESREAGWQKFLVDEAEFNTRVMKDLAEYIKTPKRIIEGLIDKHIINKQGDELIKGVVNVCGEYAGRVYPYIYALSLSNTQSRRSRAGSTFESIIYKIYELLEYPYESQSKVGKSLFTNAGLGKIVDSILPSIAAFSQRRDRTVIGTMKTSLRERWQEVSEEIQRTTIPLIYLLTVDTDISYNKAKQMSNHNIILVAPLSVKHNSMLSELKNVISFEDYLFNEIPGYLNYWK